MTPSDAFVARPVAPEAREAYFQQVKSFEADRLKAARRRARIGFLIGGVGVLVGALGVGAVAALAPLKTLVPVVFRVDNATGAVERVFDVRGGALEASEATQRYFLWQYVRLRQEFSWAEAQSSFEAVTLMSAPSVQTEYAEAFKGSNPSSPQNTLGHDGTASVRWLSTSFLGPRLAQVRFLQVERKGDQPLPTKRLVATIAFDFAPGALKASALNVNPLGFLVTRYRVDPEVVP